MKPGKSARNRTESARMKPLAHQAGDGPRFSRRAKLERKPRLLVTRSCHSWPTTDAHSGGGLGKGFAADVRPFYFWTFSRPDGPAETELGSVIIGITCSVGGRSTSKSTFPTQTAANITMAKPSMSPTTPSGLSGWYVWHARHAQGHHTGSIMGCPAKSIFFSSLLGSASAPYGRRRAGPRQIWRSASI